MKNILTLLFLAAIADSAIASTPSHSAEATKPAASAPAAAAPMALPPGHVPIDTKAKPVDLENIKVPKASGPDARTVSEVVTKRLELKDKTVVVRGKVVKFTPGVLNKNWVHLRDGSGSASDNTNDVLVTTTDATKVGDVVVAKGVVHIDKDLGSGYAYKVLIEEAALQK